MRFFNARYMNRARATLPVASLVVAGILSGLLSFGGVMAMEAEPELYPYDFIDQYDAAELNIDTEEIETVPVHKIYYRGNRTISSRIIDLAVSLQPGTEIPMTAAGFEKIIDRTCEEISRLGTFAKVVFAGAEKTPAGLDLYFDLAENPVIQEILVFGDKIIRDSEILSVVQTDTGEILNINTFKEDVDRIAALYEDRGYMMDQRSTISVDESWTKLIIDTFALKIGSISVEGNEKTREETILRECIFNVGELYEIRNLRRSYRNLLNLGFFESVDFFTRPLAQKGLAEVVVAVEEKDTGQIRFGGAYGSENGLMGLFEVSDSNLGGRGRTLRLKSEFGAERTYELGFVEPWFTGRPNSLGINAYQTRTPRKVYGADGSIDDTYDEYRHGGSLSLGRRFNHFLRGSVRISDENIRISDNVSGIEGGRSQTLALRISRDTRSNQFTPRFGTLNEFAFRTTGGMLKGANHFNTLTLDHRNFSALSDKTVFAWRATGGIIALYSGEVPNYDLFSSGGGTTIRGFREREFSGKRNLLINMELRRSLSNAFGAAIFVDSGLAGNSISNLSDLNTGAGVGVNFSTPLGVIRLDYARSISESRSARTYFNFGQMF